MKFEGSICVVTGGASGIGRQLCCHLASLGAKVIAVVDINLEKAQNVVSNDLPENVGIALQANCGSERDICKIIQTVENGFGPIDGFFCNAGILTFGDATNVPNEEWDNIWQVNVMQIIYVARHLIPLYEKRGGGCLVVTASAAGLLSMPLALPYVVTKTAAVSIAEWLSLNYKDKGVTVSCLCPQAVETGMLGSSDGGPTALDGILSASYVAKETLSAVQEGRFLVLPHQKVKKYIADKGNDYEKYILKMRKFFKMFSDYKIPVSVHSRL